MKEEKISQELMDRLFRIVVFSFQVMRNYDRKEHFSVMNYYELFLDDVILAAKMALPPKQWRESIARDIIRVELTIFNQCDIRVLEYALALVGEQ